MDEFKKIINTVITELVDLSIKNIFMDDKIYTTPFDKNGIYDYTSNVGECKFPFFDKNNAQTFIDIEIGEPGAEGNKKIRNVFELFTK